MSLPNFLFFLCFGILIFSCNSTGREKPPTEEPEETSTVVDTLGPNSATLAQVAKEQDTVSLLYGVDISDYQNDEIEFLDRQKDSLTFIICKATGGITYTDPKFQSNWKQIKQKGFVRGAYHFYYCKDDPAAQAKHYLAAIADLQKNDLPPIVDFEERSINSSQSIEEIQSNLLNFLKILQESSKRKPMIYTNLNMGNKYLNNSAFSQYALWIANYQEGDNPDLPDAWKDSQWQFWQKTSHYTIDHHRNDFDVFNGNHGDLHRFIANH